ncbi:hypothetical protein Q5P01_006790 [Channa striata]|uniref:Uncharacterized protein n=1 Tax=Channa striata TaxID=64152 RepID=A0AA88NC12_CHASR|nr:hypothetical protein Q5P01_006790 [Channa striata]
MDNAQIFQGIKGHNDSVVGRKVETLCNFSETAFPKHVLHKAPEHQDTENVRKNWNLYLKDLCTSCTTEHHSEESLTPTPPPACARDEGGGQIPSRLQPAHVHRKDCVLFNLHVSGPFL